MFPKIAAPGRARVGTLSGSVGTISESYDGTLYVNPSLTFTQNDVNDVLQGEYWNGSAWIEDTDYNISASPYFVGANVRYRVKNSFFNYTSSYITGTAGSVTDTGGASVLQSTFAAFSVSSAFILGTNPNAYARIRLIDFPVATYSGVPTPSFALKADISWTENSPAASKSASYTFAFWPTFTGGWSSAGSPPRVVVNSVSGGLADIYIEFPVTLTGTYDLTSSASVEFRAYYIDSSSSDYSTFAYKAGAL